MRMRHAAALGLMAWYLMTAPRAYRDGKPLLGVDLHAPLSAWKIEQTFEHEGDCERARDEMGSRGDQSLADAPPRASERVVTTGGGEESRWSAAFTAVTAQCIASDDPCLKSGRPR